MYLTCCALSACWMLTMTRITLLQHHYDICCIKNTSWSLLKSYVKNKYFKQKIYFLTNYFQKLCHSRICGHNTQSDKLDSVLLVSGGVEILFWVDMTQGALAVIKETVQYQWLRCLCVSLLLGIWQCTIHTIWPVTHVGLVA